MRIFWAIVAMLIAAAVAFPVAQGFRARAEAARASAAAAEARAAEARALEAESRAKGAARAAAAQAAPEPAAPAKVSESAAAVSGAPEVVAPAAAPVESRTEAPPSPVTETAPSAPQVDAPAPVVVPATPPAPAATNAPAASAPAGPDIKKPEGAVADEAGPSAKVVKKDDGTLLVDDKFVVKGEGTKEKPYQVTWEMLVSAQESYDPRQHRRKLPERVTMLDGKYLKITGYVAYPMFVEEPRELLSMLNQWDGCCIGVPPSPYDAVEVRLREPVSKEDRIATYGTVEGKFGVKPYLAGDWLVGLYIMDDAKYEGKGYGGT